MKSAIGISSSLPKSAYSLVNAAAYRSYELYLVLAEVARDVLVISEGVGSLCEPAVTVCAESFTLDAEFSAEIVFACIHLYHLRYR